MQTSPATTSATPSRSHPRRWWILAALCLSMLVVGLDGTVLNVALTDIASALHATTGQLQWVVNGYLVTLAVLLIPAGVLGDRWGRGRVLALGLTLFVVASAVAAWSTSPGQLIAARAVMGAGAAAVMPLSLSIIPTVFAPDERRKAVAIVTAALGLGMPFGPLLAGWLLDHFWWGSTLLINVPVVAVALVAGLLLIPNTRATNPARLDLPGVLLSASGLTALVYGVISGPDEGWTSPVVLGCLVGAVVLLGALVWVERRSPAPLVDRRLATRPMFVWPTVSIALSSFALLGLIFVVPQYLQAVRGLDAMATGLRLMPVMVALVVGSGIAGRLDRAAGMRATICLGLVVTAGGFALLLPVSVTSGDGLLLAGLAVVGFGFGLSVPPAMDAMLGALPAEQESTGTALNTAAKQLAGAFGVALLGTVVSSAFGSGVRGPASALPDAARSVAEGSVQGAMAIAQRVPAAVGEPLREAAGTAYVTGMHHALLVCAAVCLAAAGLLWVALPGRERRTSAGAGTQEGEGERTGAGRRPGEPAGVARRDDAVG